MRRAIVALALLALSPQQAVAAHGAPHVVSVRNNEFDPQRTEIDPGETVTWFAEDGGHTVTLDDGTFDESLDAGESVQRTFAERGVFGYHCRVHGAPGSGMWGMVVVGPGVQVLDVTVPEGNSGTADAVVPVTLSRAVTHTVQVVFATADGTAVAGVDYGAVSGTLTVPAGASAGEIRVPVIGDTAREPATSFTVALSSPSGAALERASATVRIANDDDTVRYAPSDDYPTLDAALRAIQPDTTVHVRPGLPMLTEPVTVDVDRVTITGDGEASIVAPSTNVESAFRVRADGVTIERVRIRFFSIGVDARDVGDFTLRSATLEGNRAYGVLLTGVTHASIEDLKVTRGDRAAIAIHGCEQCDTDIRGVTAELAWAGVEVLGGSGVIVRDSLLRRNANGIVLRAAPGAPRAVQSGVHVVANTIEDSGDAGASGPKSPQARIQSGQVVRGAGVWIDGGWDNVVEGNLLLRNRFGITVSSFSGPSLDDRIERNAFEGSAVWDLAWDGVGAGTCFGGSTVPDDEELLTQPPEAETLYPCGARPTAGAPWPVVTAQLLAG